MSDDKKNAPRGRSRSGSDSNNDKKNSGNRNNPNNRRDASAKSNNRNNKSNEKSGNSRGGSGSNNGGGNNDNSKKLRIIPMGGMGEIGKNMLLFEYDDEMMIVDGGLAFPDADMLGVDILVPKIDYVIENAHKIKGWVLTHGHEDHIGGLPYMLKLLPKIPMYGAKLTLGFLRGKFDEFKLSESDVDLNEITPDDRIKISKYFTVDFFRMTHSIPDNSGLIIHTPIGRVVHTGDFKLDYHPADGKTSHLHKIAQAGQDGVLALISDSTRAESPGHSPSERDIMAAIEAIVTESKGRVIVTTFSSHVHRLQNVIRIAEKHDRRIFIEGRSMIKNTRIAHELGYLESKNSLTGSEGVQDMQDDKVLFLCTGSQGQPMAALSRLAAGNHSKITLKPGDTVIMSSSPIPGNEEAVGRVINQLYAADVNVFYPPAYKVHTSGHAYQDELKLILDLTRPKFFIPWHGEVRHQKHHQRLSRGMSNPPKKSLIVENGDIVDISRDDMKINGSVESGFLLLDSAGRGTGEEIAEPIIRDRQALSNEGIVVIVGVLGKQPSVEVVSRGVVKHDKDVIAEIERLAMEGLKRGLREKRRNNDIRDDIFYPVRRYLRKATGRSPVIVPTLVQG